jgi:speckle-type POZ protein
VEEQGSYLDRDCLTIRCALTVVIESRTVENEMNSVIVPLSSLHQDFGRC